MPRYYGVGKKRTKRPRIIASCECRDCHRRDERPIWDFSKATSPRCTVCGGMLDKVVVKRAMAKSAPPKPKPAYDEYIKSEAWQSVRRRYFASPLPKHCLGCHTETNITLHHITYDNLGSEHLTELVPLCWACHMRLHAKCRHHAPPRTERPINFFASAAMKVFGWTPELALITVSPWLDPKNPVGHGYSLLQQLTRASELIGSAVLRKRAKNTRRKAARRRRRQRPPQAQKKPA